MNKKFTYFPKIVWADEHKKIVKFVPKKFIVPERIQVEVAFGCNAGCKMCPINLPSKRKKGVMSFEMFKQVIDQMEPYKEHIQKVDFWGVGEPLLDGGLFEKIKYAKSKGFHGLAIASNVDLMNKEKQDKLLESGIDSIIFGVDGIKKETHEALRIGVDFDNVIKNTLSIIKKRNEGNYKTRFIIRFVKQEKNKNEWEEYKKYWERIISKDKKDMIIGYDIRSWDKEVPLPDGRGWRRDEEMERRPCHHVFDRLIVLQDGTVPMCCGDFHHGNYPLGNIKDTSLIEIFNNQKMREIRDIHLSGNKNNISICNECTILYSEEIQERC
jgi:MoaA/NifB/PqqE/SkfB family radical SAM enzyme